MSSRKVHLWLGVVVLVQTVLWIVTGVGFGLLPGEETQGLVESRRLKPAPVAAQAAKLSASDVATVLERRLGQTADIQKITLFTRAPKDTIVFLVALRNQPEPALIDARSGDQLPLLTESEAMDIARADFNGQGDVTGAEWITQPYQKGYDYDGPLPAYRVNFSNSKRTRLYVSPYTGQILARRNIYATVRNLFWTLHVFGYLDRNVQANAPILVTGAISLIATASGALMYVPYLRRRRLARAALSSPSPVLAMQPSQE